MASQVVRFGLFEVDLSEGTLAKNGRTIKLQEQPFRLLAMLLEQPGETVTRERLKEALWSGEGIALLRRSSSRENRRRLQDGGDCPLYWP